MKAALSLSALMAHPPFRPGSDTGAAQQDDVYPAREKPGKNTVPETQPLPMASKTKTVPHPPPNVRRPPVPTVLSATPTGGSSVEVARCLPSDLLAERPHPY